MHIYKGVLFLHDRHNVEHAGFVCVKCSSCVLSGGSYSGADRIVSFFQQVCLSFFDCPRKTVSVSCLLFYSRLILSQGWAIPSHQPMCLHLQEDFNGQTWDITVC